MIAVIDYGASNLPNAVRALRSVGADLIVTSDPTELASAEGIVLPGVGATADTMAALRRLGMDKAVHALVAEGRPFLGICVGMQVLCSRSEEFFLHDCLGVLEGTVRRLPGGQKVPQIGWNQIALGQQAQAHPVFDGIPDGSEFYFVHSFYCDLADPTTIAAETEYGLHFPSALLHGRLVATQFHPEKSGRLGLRLLQNFVRWVETIPLPTSSDLALSERV